MERIGLQGGGVPSRHRQLHHQLQGGALNRGRYIIPHTKINNQTIIDRSNQWYSSNQPQPCMYTTYTTIIVLTLYKRVTTWPTASVCANDFSSKFDLEIMTDNDPTTKTYLICPTNSLTFPKTNKCSTITQNYHIFVMYTFKRKATIFSGKNNVIHEN